MLVEQCLRVSCGGVDSCRAALIQCVAQLAVQGPGCGVSMKHREHQPRHPALAGHEFQELHEELSQPSALQTAIPTFQLSLLVQRVFRDLQVLNFCMVHISNATHA